LTLRCHVMGFEYLGYGPALGPVSERNCYISLLTAYNCLIGHYTIPKNRIVLWGRSLGTGPTVHQAAHLGTNIAGVILESPLRSIIRTIVSYECTTCPCDMFANQDKVRQIKVPVHIEHGTIDMTVPTSHGKHLHGLLGAKSWEPRWWPNLHHNNMPRIWMANEAESRKAREGTHVGMTREQTHTEQRRTLRDFLLYLLEQQRAAAHAAAAAAASTEPSPPASGHVSDLGGGPRPSIPRGSDGADLGVAPRPASPTPSSSSSSAIPSIHSLPLPTAMVTGHYIVPIPHELKSDHEPAPILHADPTQVELNMPGQ